MNVQQKWRQLGWRHTVWDLVRYYCSFGRAVREQDDWLNDPRTMPEDASGRWSPVAHRRKRHRDVPGLPDGSGRLDRDGSLAATNREAGPWILQNVWSQDWDCRDEELGSSSVAESHGGGGHCDCRTSLQGKRNYDRLESATSLRLVHEEGLARHCTEFGRGHSWSGQSGDHLGDQGVLGSHQRRQQDERRPSTNAISLVGNSVNSKKGRSSPEFVMSCYWTAKISGTREGAT